MAVDSMLKRVLKLLKEKETVISMVFGALVVLAAAIILVNIANNNRSSSDLVLVEEVKNSEQASTESAQPKSLIQQAGTFLTKLLTPSEKAEPVAETEPTIPDSPKIEADAQGDLMVTNLPQKHLVVKGDSLWKIAEKYYASGYNWVDIAKANPTYQTTGLEAGQELVLPQVRVRVPVGGLNQVKTASTPTTNVKSGDYTVAKGDSLWTIAVSQYNDGYQWTKIYEANKTVISNPSVIEVGWNLVIPR